jgi:hypothetical protein
MSAVLAAGMDEILTHAGRLRNTTRHRKMGRTPQHGGVAGPNPDTGRTLQRVRDDLALAMRDARIDWLRALPLTRRNGNLLITHAGADPARDPNDQRSKDLLWGCEGFTTTLRTDGLWVAYGHVIQDAPSAENGRIALDTGAYATGVLTAAILGDGPPRFATTVSGGAKIGPRERREVRRGMKFNNHRHPHKALGGRPAAVAYSLINEGTRPYQQGQRLA